jgi:hypothetical protein
VGWDYLGIQLHIIARAVPKIAGVAQKVVHLIGAMKIKSQSLGGEIYPT